MKFKKFILSLLAGAIMCGCSAKPKAVVYPVQSFFNVVSKKTVKQVQSDEIPDWISGDLRGRVARVLYVLPSYWQIGSVYEMLSRFGFPDYMFYASPVDYLLELLSDKISDEERAMLKNSANLDEVKINLQRMIIAYEAFMKNIKIHLTERICIWLDQNYQQLWKYGSEIEATAEPFYISLRGGQEARVCSESVVGSSIAPRKNASGGIKVVRVKKF